MPDGACGLARLESREAVRNGDVELAVQLDVERLLGGRSRLGGGRGQWQGVQLHVVFSARLHMGVEC